MKTNKTKTKSFCEFVSFFFLFFPILHGFIILFKCFKTHSSALCPTCLVFIFMHFCQFGFTSNAVFQENLEIAKSSQPLKARSNMSRYHSRVRQHASRAETGTYTQYFNMPVITLSLREIYECSTLYLQTPDLTH